jgi:diguanylate cyclase (GGDEF)-like protein
MKGTDKYPHNDIEEETGERNADLGLFYQLLQMVNGNWADSIQGICNHIHHHIRSLGLILSVYDSSFNEFIYVSYSIDQAIEKIMLENNVSIQRESMMEILMNVFKNHKDLLEERTFDEKYLEEITLTILKDPEKAKSVLRILQPRTLTVIQSPVTYRQYKCYFHIISNRSLTEANKILINNYIPQLNVALEIVFFVRDLYIKATHDGLTKLFDHRQGIILLGREMERVKRNKQPLTLVMLDLDHFKTINDKYGHPVGDAVLTFIGNFLTDSLRKCDIISRYGGEEFLIALPETPIRIARDVTKRLKDSIEKHVFYNDDKNFSITGSFGLAVYDPEKHTSCQHLIEAADTMLYRAKEKGRNRIEY